MSAGDMGTSEIAQRLRQGEEEALAALWARERNRLSRSLRFRLDPRLATRVDPEDILQEAYLAALKRIDRFNADRFENPFVWFRLILRQVIVDIHRHHLGAQGRDARRETPIAGRYPQDTSVSVAIHLINNATSPSHAVGRQEKVDRVRAAIDDMDATDREVLALRHFEELSNQETAEALGIQPKAASIRYVRALERLKAILHQHREWFEGDSHG